MGGAALETSDVLALDRTRLAAERTLMAWLRTALSMITFGFTIYKFLQAIQAQGTVPGMHPHSARIMGLALVGIGTFALLFAIVQHWKYIRRICPTTHPYSPWDLASIVSCLVALLGLLVLGSMVLKAGPLG
jgi:putative membrane protein